MAQLPPVLQKFIDKFSNSRDFTISFTLHAILVAIFGTTVLFQVTQEPPDFEGGSDGFVAESTQNTPPPENTVPQETTFQVTAPVTPPASSMNAITSTAPSAIDFSMPTTITTPTMTQPTAPTQPAVAPSTSTPSMSGMTAAAASQIKAFSGGWGKGQGAGVGLKSREFEFTAYIGQYAGGNWNSTIRVSGSKIEMGSLPNLLYYMSFVSRDKIKTNYTNVQAIKLDSNDLFTIKPPFIFMTGTRDFKLTDKEVENLQKYVRMGGCIWGDSSVPGLRSRFDIAFRREMKRVIPDVDKDFEALPANHPMFTQTYFSEIKDVPPGLNFYRLPVYALKLYGEISIIYTANDYGDMWQIGLDKDGKIDQRRTEGNSYVALNKEIYDQREVYIRNLSVPALVDTYKFGTNMIIHLLTRWESKTRNASSAAPGGI